MSLSARIAVRASRRLEAISACVAIGGVVAAATSVAGHWPGLAWPLVVAGAATAIAIALVRVRAARDQRTASGYVLSVTDHADIAVSPDLESGDGESWRLDDSTMMWPGFSVIGLRRGDDVVQAGRSMRLAVFDAELSAIDRRALHRFLLWSLRGGGGSRTPSPAAHGASPS